MTFQTIKLNASHFFFSGYAAYQKVNASIDRRDLEEKELSIKTVEGEGNMLRAGALPFGRVEQ